MSNKPILVLKQSTGATLFQQIGDEKRPSFMDLGRTVFGPKGTGFMNRLVAGLGLAGKTAAGGATVLDTAHKFQGGNLAAPLGAGYTYTGFDPTGKFLGERVQAGKKGAEAYQSRQPVGNVTANVTPSTPTTGYTPPNLRPPSSQVRVRPPVNPTPQSVNTNVGGTTMGPPPVNVALPPNVSPATMAGHMNPSQQYSTGGVAPTQAPPAGVPNSQIVHTGIAANTAFNQPSVNAGQVNPLPPTDPYASYQQQQLQFRPSGPQGALPPNMSSAAQQRGPPPAHTSTMHQASPMDQAMATFNQTPSAHSTANPLSQSDINYANEVLAQYHNTLPRNQQASMNTYGSSAVSPHQAQGQGDWQQGVQWGQQKPHMGEEVNWNPWGNAFTQWPEPNSDTQKMLKAFISYLYDNMGSYLYKMTPHEAGAFAVDVFFKMRE